MSQFQASIGSVAEPEPSSLNAPGPPGSILSFPQYKALHGASADIDEPTVYDPSTEQYPDDEWYTLEHDEINSGIHDMCTPVLHAVSKCPPDDTEVSNLDAALQTANIIPRGQQFFVAFLGEQGIGKSSLINAVLNRDLVNVSASSSACTAYPTIITYKVGASDDTAVSDIRIEYLSENEIRECAQEQARRYREAFPCRSRNDPNRDTDGLAEIDLDDDLSDDEDDLEVPMPDSDFSRPRAIRPSVMRGAKTAKYFFSIIFAAEDDEERAKSLRDDLDYTNIEGESFVNTCVDAAKERLSTYVNQAGDGQPDVVDDEELADFQAVNDRIWPLIKSVRIETGHVLLRNNVGILDLPGYGDDNHIRTALIDKFREMAHFEIVVAPSSRVVSSVVQERYLNRSIRRLGARNTLLVTNKSDQLFNGVRKHVNKIREAPFPLLKEHLAGIETIAREGIEDNGLVRAYRGYLLKEARRAYIERETAIIKLSLQDKDVDILSVSAREYALCLGAEYAEEDDEKPKLTPEATGLPQLRRYLFHVPAQTNYRTLHYHVFETLPEIAARIERILEKFDDDEGYTEMREYLAEQLPQVRSSIENLAISLPNERVVRPFVGDGVKPRIKAGMKAVVQALANPVVYYSTFSKMLKENGIPVNGAGLGLNLNQEILNAMVNFINGWHDKMQDETEDIATTLDEAIQAVLKELRKYVYSYDGDSDLKDRVIELLETTTRRISMAYGKMAALLQTKLREIHHLYSTEVNIKCPIALEMKDIYRNVLMQHLTQPGAGSYARQRAHLLGSLVDPDWPKLPLAEVMEQKIVTAQVGSWKECCRQYVVEAMTLLQDFARATDETLDNGALLTSEHRRVREQLEALIPEFKRQLNRVQNQFPVAGTARASSVPKTPSNKRKTDDERSATQPPTSESHEAKRLKTLSQLSQIRATSAQPVAWLRERFLARFEQTSRPVVKREPSP